ncbi:MAG: histidine--tRNA ligase [Spirochaetaceae bacterium]|nr:histidine--tRNA ligase [Spirochaetaceae bacterium]
MSSFIEPRVLKGFRDYLPEAEIARSALADKLEATFRSFGFVPIDTPALEYAEILLGKGGGETDKQVYRFRDNGDRDVALRFDLTVPFARFMAEHCDELYLPFRRYHLGKVWRAENTQRGRYREFMQCDFDIVGTDSASADADIVLTIVSAMAALDVGPVRVRVNHRGLFNRFLAAQGVSDKLVSVLRTVDKLEKVGPEETRNLLAAETSMDLAGRVMDFITPEGSSAETLRKMISLCGNDDEEAAAAGKRLSDVFSIATSCGFGDSVNLDPGITRGLDYYTGIVFETTLLEMPGIGSVCSGGRYNELASLYTAKNLPGVGASIGLDRLLAALEALGRRQESDPVPLVLIANTESVSLAQLHGQAMELRKAGISSEVFPEPKKMSHQYSYAEKKGIPYALMPDGDSLARGVLPLKDLARRSTTEFGSLSSLVEFLKSVKMHG